MLKSQYVVIVLAGLAIVGLSLMPKAVVHNQRSSESAMEEEISAESSHEDEETHATEHGSKIPHEIRHQLDSLEALYASVSDQQDKLTILDSLASLFTTVNRLDSAAQYVADFCKEYPTSDNFLKAGELYYEAFSFAIDDTKRQLLGKQTRFFLEKYLEENPDSPDVQVKIGVTYVTSSSPMQGILMIRKVLDKYPDHRLALENLGVLAIQSGQFEKAVGRFEHLIKLAPAHSQYRLYLAVSYLQLGKDSEALEHLNYVKEHETNEAVLKVADNYLQQLQSK